jgi:hypothetical protein
MIKYAAVAVAALLCLVTSRVYGQGSDTLELNAMDFTYFANSEGNAWLVDGNLVMMGQIQGLGTTQDVAYLLGMAGPMHDEQITLAQKAALLAAFVPLNMNSQGLSGEGNLGFTDQGMIDHLYSGNNFAGGPIYVLAFNAATPEAATEMGVFVGNGTDNPNWIYPANMNLPGLTQSPSLDNAMPLVGFRLPTAMDNVWDDNWNGHGAPLGAMELADIVPIPEPSTLMLVGLGLLGAVGLRRRHRS